MSGYQRRGVHGLGQVTNTLSTIFTDASGVLRSVQPAIGGVIGPGGSLSASPLVSPPMSSTSTSELLLLLGIGALIWWLM